MRNIVQLTLAFAAAVALAGVAHAGSTVFANGKELTHKGSGGAATTVLDVSKTPSPGGPVPIPYPNMGQQTGKDTQKKTKSPKETPTKKTGIVKNSGDEPGTLKGVVSSKNMDKVKVKAHSTDVKLEGKNPSVMINPLLQNSASNANASAVPGGAVVAAPAAPLPPTAPPPAAGAQPDAQETYGKIDLERRVVTSVETRPKEPLLTPLAPVAPVAPPRAFPRPAPALTPIAAPKIQPAPIPLPAVPLPVTKVEPVKVPQPIVVQPVRTQPVLQR